MKFLIILLSLCAATLHADTQTSSKVVILKLDDFSSRADSPTENWQRVVDYLEAQEMAASFGIIGKDITRANPEFCKWILAKQEAGLIEFWNHGETHGRIEKDGKKVAEFQDTVEAQIASLEATQQLAVEKLGFEFKSFGAPFNAVNADTATALEKVGIPIWIYGLRSAARDGGYTGAVLTRTHNMEKGTSNPNFEYFKAQYLKKQPTGPLVLQGHPHGWSEERFQEFVQIVEFLKSEGYVFQTPSGFVAGN